MAELNGRLGGEHVPRRPQWDCLACEQAWPCDPARVRLAEQYGDSRINLSIYLGGLLFVATAELPDANPADLHERFVAWTRRPVPGGMCAAFGLTFTARSIHRPNA